MLAERKDRTHSGQSTRLDTYMTSSAGSGMSGPTAARFEPVLVEHDAGYFTVEDRLTGVFGTGATVDDAVRDFRDAVGEHLDVLERQDELSPDLQRQLEYLRTVLS